ncbi:MAG: RAMP superfamily CRISPR-associated protein [Bilifractor sp.]
MKNVNPITERIYYAVSVRFLAPVLVSNGENLYTDADVIRDRNGRPFIPGTSLAGAFRGRMGEDKATPSVYGYSSGEEGRMSHVYISDLLFDSFKVTTRDRVQLSEEKTVENKFNMEAIDTGAEGTFFIEIINRANDRFQAEPEVRASILSLADGMIRIGADKNRGFGKAAVTRVGERRFTAASRNEWILFLGKRKDPKEYPEADISKWKNKTADDNGRVYAQIEVPLSLQGGISIRKYSADPGRADYEHITANGKPVIPGTSWAGAIRWDAQEILDELGVLQSRKKELMDKWFGPRGNEKLHQSQIMIDESVLEGAVRMPVSRTRINRFTGGTVNAALYSEIAYYGGSTILRLSVKKSRNKDERIDDAAVGLLLLVVDDIRKGHLAIGGQVSVGRGLFRSGGEVQVLGNAHTDSLWFRKAFARLIKEDVDETL